jgi:hypothetical protein
MGRISGAYEERVKWEVRRKKRKSATMTPAFGWAVNIIFLETFFGASSRFKGTGGTGKCKEKLTVSVWLKGLTKTVGKT